MPNQFFSPEGDLETYFVSEYWLIDQYIGDQLWTWGTAENGRLGNAQIIPSTSGVSTPVVTFAGGTNWKQLSVSEFRTFAIKTDGTLWTWGYGGLGRLGNAQVTSNVSTPITTFAGGTNWKQVSSGYRHTAAIKTDGTLWIWGDQQDSRLGNGFIVSNISTPITTFAGGTNWKQVSCGGSHTAAIKTDGTLWTWGTASQGQLGTNDVIPNRSTPVTTFAGGANWKQVSAAVGGSCIAAIKTDGTLWTWGANSNGQLANASITNRSIPVTTFVGGTNWKQVSASYAHMTAIKTDGTLWTWGSTTRGKLGNGVIIGNVSTPITTFAGGNNWKQISCGYGTSAIKTDGTLWNWGRNDFGQLANGSITNASTPVTTLAGGNKWKQCGAIAFRHSAAIESGIIADYPLL
jgi:alpha-tubulin suppressor-like RCC1 family protein